MPTVQAIVQRAMSHATTRVFDAWLNPAMIAGFMFGPHLRDEQIVRLQIDPRVGGQFSFVVNRQGTEVNHVGEYLHLDRARDLRFTWAVAGSGAGSIVRIGLVPAGQGCDLTLVHEMAGEWAGFVSRSEQAWGRMLLELDAALSASA